jgi:hypothetical protein
VQTVSAALVDLAVSHADDPALCKRAADALDPLLALIRELNRRIMFCPSQALH